MPEAIARANGEKSKVRAFVEHVFARQKWPVGMFIRTIGLAQSTMKIGLANLTYNMKYRWSPMRLQPEVLRQLARCIFTPSTLYATPMTTPVVVETWPWFFTTLVKLPLVLSYEIEVGTRSGSPV
jgi:hypothetical protein